MIESNEEQEWVELKNNWRALCSKKSKKGEKPRIL